MNKAIAWYTKKLKHGLIYTFKDDFLLFITLLRTTFCKSHHKGVDLQ